MISRISQRFGSQLLSKRSFKFTESSGKSPIIFGNGKSLFSLSQWWSGSPPRPFDYYVQDTLKSQITEGWTLQDGFFRVLFPANVCDGSMNININQLKNSEALNQLIQLSASEKEKLVENPSTVIIVTRTRFRNLSSRNSWTLERIRLLETFWSWINCLRKELDLRRAI